MTRIAGVRADHNYHGIFPFPKGGIALRIYVGNFSVDVTEAELRRTFEAFGAVSFVKISQDLTHDAPVNFALLGMANRRHAESAIAALRTKNLKGKVLTVCEAGVQNRQMETGN